MCKDEGRRVPEIEKEICSLNSLILLLHRNALSSIYFSRVRILHQWRVLIFFYIGYPSLFSGCSGDREKSKRAVGTHHQPSPLPFPSNCSRSFFFSLSIALYFYWKTQERRRGRKREREPSIFYYRYSLLAASLSLSLLFVALIIYYDMIGERLILLLCRKAISLRLLISYGLSIYLIPAHHSIIILWRTLRRLDSTIYRAIECVLKRGGEKEKEEICNELSLGFFPLSFSVILLWRRRCSCTRATCV